MKELIKICIVSASKNEEFYWQQQFPKSDLIHFSDKVVSVTFDLYPNNTKSLGEVYNQALTKYRNDMNYIIFIHNDIVIKNLIKFIDSIVSCKTPIMGVAGAINFPKEGVAPLSWFTQSAVIVNNECAHQAGDVYHKQGNGIRRSLYGNRASAQNVKAIDGLCMVFSTPALLNTNLMFDPQFTFDFYDLDICYQAAKLGLQIDIIDVGGLIHYSVGNGINSQRYKDLEKIFRAKWNIPVKTY